MDWTKCTWCGGGDSQMVCAACLKQIRCMFCGGDGLFRAVPVFPPHVCGVEEMPLIPTTEEQKHSKPTKEWVDTVCLIGQGRSCCRYLVVGPQGFQCQKNGELAHALDTKAMLGDMTAISNNCEGRA